MVNYWVILPAGGQGNRFSAALQKQYCQIGEKTVLEYSAGCFLQQSWVKQIIIPLSSEDQHFSTLPLFNEKKIHTILAGKERFFSVLNALDYLKDHADPNDWVLTHDAVRPCLHQNDLLQLKNTLENDPIGGILATPVQDTIKYVRDEKNISHTVSRQPLWQALTPQMFRMGILWKSYQYCQEKGLSITDDASAIEQAGAVAKIVPAQHPNPKLTYSYDLPYVQKLLMDALEIA